jgi:hypothetical protein
VSALEPMGLVDCGCDVVFRFGVSAFKSGDIQASFGWMCVSRDDIKCVIY